MPSGTHGPRHTNLNPTLERAWNGGFLTKSDFARVNADEVAVAASLGLITTQVTPEDFHRVWLITPKGINQLWQQKELMNERH